MNRYRRVIVASLITATISLGLAASSPAAPPATAASESPEIGAVIAKAWRDHIAAAIRKDLAAVVDIYADDIVYVVAGEPEVRGREAMTTMEARTLAGFDVVSAEHVSDALRTFGDAAYELGTIVGPIRPKDGEARTVTFNFMALWRRQADGAWRIAHLVAGPVSE